MAIVDKLVSVLRVVLTFNISNTDNIYIFRTFKALEIMWYIQFFQKRSFQSDLYKGPIGLLDYTNFNFNGNFIFFFKKSLEEARLDNTVHSGNLISALLASYDIKRGVFK